MTTYGCFFRVQNSEPFWILDSENRKICTVPSGKKFCSKIRARKWSGSSFIFGPPSAGHSINLESRIWILLGGRSCWVNGKRRSFVSVVGNDQREQRKSTNIRQIYFRRSLKVSGQFHHDKTTHVLLTEASKFQIFRKNCFRSHSWNGFIDLESKLKTCQPFPVLSSEGFLDCFINVTVLCPSIYQPQEHHKVWEEHQKGERVGRSQRRVVTLLDMTVENDTYTTSVTTLGVPNSEHVQCTVPYRTVQYN